MSIEKRGGIWYLRFKHHGREFRESTGLPAVSSNRREAERMEAARRLEVRAERVASKRIPSPPFDKSAREFISWCFTNEYRAHPNSARRIATSFVSLANHFGETAVDQIDMAAVEAYKTMRFEVNQVRDITVRHDLHALSVFFNKWAVPRRFALVNPVDAVSKPSDEAAVRIHVITAEEESRYFAHARGALYDVGRIILLQGCRPEEVLALTVDAVDLERGEMHIRGGKSRAAKRTLPLHGEVSEILKRRIYAGGGGEADPTTVARNASAIRRESVSPQPVTPPRPASATWVFPSPRRPGEHLAKLNCAHDRCCREAQVSFVLYDLRHTWATRMLTEAKADVPTVAALMGHSSPTIVLKHYAHPTETAKRAAMRDYESLAKKPLLRRVK